MEAVKREWHWFDWFMVSSRFLFLTIFIFSLYAAPEIVDGHLRGMPYWLIVNGLPHEITTVLLLFLFFASHIFWNPRGVHQIHAFWTEILLIVVLLILCFTIDFRYSHLFPFICLQLGFICRQRMIKWCIPIMVIYVVLIRFFLQEVPWTEYYFIYGLYCLLCFGYANVFYRLMHSEQQTNQLLTENKEQYQLIQEKNKALVQHIKQIEKMTIVEERNRMARELHDTIGHTFTSVIMGMDAVSYLIEADPEKAKEKLDVLRNVARNGLEEVRNNIHAIADEESSSLSIQVNLLTNEFALHTGTKTHTHVKGKEYEVSKQVRWTLIRCLQESLTNAKRHGQALRVEVTLKFSPRQIQLKISDDGIGASDIQPGFGITAMKERVRPLNGDLQLQTEQGKGMTVICTLPTGGERVGITTTTTGR
jgi:signal transduction histidine kinase